MHGSRWRGLETEREPPRQPPTLLHHRMVRSRGVGGRRQIEFLARWPTTKAMQRARDRIRELTARSRLRLPVEAIVQDVNVFLRGWAGYFKYGNSSQHFDKINSYVRMRIARVISKRHRRSRGFSWSVLHYQSRNALGLVSLVGIVVAPRANQPRARDRPNAGGERRR
jgi:hypothetical protein